MRADHNFKVFSGHEDWYTFQIGIGYVPTEKAPKEAIEAMKKFNSYTYKWNNNE